MEIVDNFIEKARKLKGKIVLPEADDIRILAAAQKIAQLKLAQVVLVGNPDDINSLAKKNGILLETAEILEPQKFNDLEKFTDFYFERRKKKGITRKQAASIVLNPLYFGTLLVKFGYVDGMVAGAANTTGEVLKAALHVVGVKAGLKTVSSSFIMVVPNYDRVLLFADCAVVPEPTSQQLADIAMSTATTRRKLLGDEPIVSLLSFSTKGSAQHEKVDKVVAAKKVLEERKVDFAFDGELQLDAALVEKIGKSKAPDSKVAGKANTLIFPELQSGNIGYKLVQRLAGAEAIGPVIQGLAAPVCDLSRGCSTDDIVNTTAIVLLMSK
ncbi:MAG TPA: phosphate acetyltransferase [Candidatus Cloacimonas sp.]|jgi:phosphate acetyltransferase|nr:phosphate acetyltransferase [Candidatus Cloacimonas sp.]